MSNNKTKQQSSPPPATDKQVVTEKVRSASSILVALGDSPSIDTYCSAIGLVMMLNKAGKQAVAISSSDAPPNLAFLKPEQVLNNDQQGAGDLLIEFDRARADRFTWDKDDKVVKISITPKGEGITAKDIRISQAEFSVDLVIALNVKSKAELESVFKKHGRVLHSAKTVSINSLAKSSVGGPVWQDEKSSSLSEMVVSMSESIQSGIIDQQIATALLTGIMSATNRFSGKNTTPKAMTMSAQLMAAGANQQDIHTNLESIGGNNIAHSSSPEKPTASSQPMHQKPNTPETPAQQAPLASAPVSSPKLPIVAPVQPAPKPQNSAQHEPLPPAPTKKTPTQIQDQGIQLPPANPDTIVSAQEFSPKKLAPPTLPGSAKTPGAVPITPVQHAPAPQSRALRTAPIEPPKPVQAAAPTPLPAQQIATPAPEQNIVQSHQLSNKPMPDRDNQEAVDSAREDLMAAFDDLPQTMQQAPAQQVSQLKGPQPLIGPQDTIQKAPLPPPPFGA